MTAIDLDQLLPALDAAGDDPIERVLAAERLAEELRTVADRLVGFAIEQARVEGCSWADIGEQLGISRQAAQQRYAPRQSSLSVDDLIGAGSLDRFTPRAVQVLRRAPEATGRLGLSQIEPTAILLAILDDDSMGVTVLRSMGAVPERVRPRLERDRRQSTDAASVPLGAASRRVLRQALTEALGLGHNYIGTEHLLLGLLHDPEVAALLGRQRVTLERARDATRAELERAVLSAS